MADYTALTDAGVDIDALTADEHEALGRLDQSEVDALAGIKAKLNGEDEVGGFAVARRADTGGIVW